MNFSPKTLAIFTAVVLGFGLLGFFSMYLYFEYIAPKEAAMTPPPPPEAPPVEKPQITAEERAVLFSLPTASSTQAESDTFWLTVRKYAEQTETLSIGNDCSMKPIVARVSQGTKLVIKNNDSTERRIISLTEQDITLAPNQEYVLNIDFGGTSGTEEEFSNTVGYACSNGKGGLAGLLVY